MSKIINVTNIVIDAYQQAFIKLEAAKFLESEKLLDFAVKNMNDDNSLMNDYAYVIIYSNTGRVDMAIQKCQDIINSEKDNVEIKTIVRDIYNQLSATFDYVTPQPQTEKYPNGYDILLKSIKPVKKKDIDNFIDCIAETDREIEFLEAYYASNDIERLEKFENEKKFFSNVYAECVQIEEILAEGIDKLEAKPNISGELHRLFLGDFSNHYAKFLYLHQHQLIDTLLKLNVTPVPIKNMLAFNLCRLYEAEIISDEVLDINFKGEIFRSSIKDHLEIFYETTANPITDCLKKLYAHPDVDMAFHTTVDEVLELLYSLTFPTLVTESSNIENFVVAILYFVSIQEYANGYHHIIESVYNLSEEQVTDELNLVELIVNL